MTRADWPRIRALFHRAMEHPTRERAAFLHELRDDEVIRQEVESLLAAHVDADGFLDGSPVRVSRDVEGEVAPPALAPGHRFGSFEILGSLGVGGMGEVYRARDTRLHREVAVKLLPTAFTRDEDRIGRFEREARLLAALNHPHIATIHSIEDVLGVRALVLELVEGQTLAARVAAGPLPLQEALSIASELAEGLEAAHAKGIIHRDLKPANVKITPAGVVKLLDFGLATVTARDDAASDSPGATATAGFGTRDGLIVGTAAYMSPEQARGRPVDKRTDMWGFGCVLYEMLTGRAAFRGPTMTDTLAAVLEREPDWRALPEATPLSVRRLLRRALQKEPALRLRDIGDARLELLSVDDMESAPPWRAHGMTWTRPRVLAVSAVSMAVLAAVFLGGSAFVLCQRRGWARSALPCRLLWAAHSAPSILDRCSSPSLRMEIN